MLTLCNYVYVSFISITKSSAQLLTFSVTVQSTAEKIIFLILYHVLFVMFVWSYFQTIFIEVGRVPDKVRENNRH